MTESHPARTPFPFGFQARPATDQEHDAAKHLDYPQLAGSILYAATISRPDLSFPAGILTRYIANGRAIITTPPSIFYDTYAAP